MKKLDVFSCLLFVIFLICTYVELFWLSDLIAIILVYQMLLFQILFLIKKKILKIFIHLVADIIKTLYILFIIHTFVAELFYIPSNSMTNTLYPKDIVLVDKLYLGPILPETIGELSFSYIFNFIGMNDKEFISSYLGELRRLSGFAQVKRGDILVFEFDEIMVKRCVALPGDTIRSEDANIYINNILIKESENVRKTYSFKLTKPKKFFNLLDSLNIQSEISVLDSRSNTLMGDLSINEAENIKSSSYIETFRLLNSTKSINSKMFPFYKSKKWTLDNFGNITIPKKGITIELNPDTYNMYKFILKEFEKVNIQEVNEKFFLNTSQIYKYTFKKNYYYMLGDFRKNSRDSRYIGFIPEENLMGKVYCVLFSYKNNRFNWDRFLRKL